MADIAAPDAKIHFPKLRDVLGKSKSWRDIAHERHRYKLNP